MMIGQEAVTKKVVGVDLDPQTRCAHYHSPLDIIAIKMKCCGTYYACKDCHEALADHPMQVWPIESWDEKAILCGNCGDELSIRDYLVGGNTCPTCSADFNPGCRNHHHHYFADQLNQRCNQAAFTNCSATEFMQ